MLTTENSEVTVEPSYSHQQSDVSSTTGITPKEQLKDTLKERLFFKNNNDGGIYGNNNNNATTTDGCKFVNIMHQNIQCLRNKIPELDILINNTISNIDILCVTEHWLRESEYSFYILPNYQLASIFCRTTHRGGGTAIYIKNDFKYKCKNHTLYLNEEMNFEHVVAEVEISAIKLLIVCIYKSPDSKLEIFFKKLESLIDLLKKEKYLVICGDFNVNFLTNNAARTEFELIMQSFKLNPIINTATRITDLSNTCLDQIFVKLHTFPLSTYNLNTGVSDHNAVLVNIHLPNDVKTYKAKRETVWRRNYSKDNINYFKFLLSKEKWYDVLGEHNINKKVQVFMDTVAYNFNIAFPLRSVRIKTNKVSPKSWITKGIITSCRRKRLLLNISKTNNDQNLKKTILKSTLKY